MKVKLTPNARNLRKRQTDAEAKLWARLRNHRCHGYKFKRQAPRGPYIVDFVCLDVNLVIEVDGSQHMDKRADYDKGRTAFLESEGYEVLRFWNTEVLKNTDGVMTMIEGALLSFESLSSGAARHPLSQGRGLGTAKTERKRS